MPREKPLFRENLERLDNAYPGKELLTREEAAIFLGVSIRTIDRNYKKAKISSRVSKIKFARALADEC